MVGRNVVISICIYCGWDLGCIYMCIGVYWFYLLIIHVHPTNDVNYLLINIPIIHMIL